jgi:hypothetical protein
VLNPSAPKQLRVLIGCRSLASLASPFAALSDVDAVGFPLRPLRVSVFASQVSHALFPDLVVHLRCPSECADMVSVLPADPLA